MRKKYYPPPLIETPLDFSLCKGLRSFSLLFKPTSFHRRAMIEQLRLPPTLTSLRLNGIDLLNLKDQINEMKELTVLELTFLSDSKWETDLPATLTELTLHSHLPAPLPSLISSLYALKVLRILDFAITQPLLILKLPLLEELTLDPSYGTVVLADLPRLRALTFHVHQFLLAKGLSTSHLNFETPYRYQLNVEGLEPLLLADGVSSLHSSLPALAFFLSLKTPLSALTSFTSSL